MGSVIADIWEPCRDAHGVPCWYKKTGSPSQVIYHSPYGAYGGLSGAPPNPVSHGIPQQPLPAPLAVPVCAPAAMTPAPFPCGVRAEDVWVECVDNTAAKNKFWYNVITKEKTWDKPSEHKVEAMRCPSPPPPRPPSKPKELKDEWIRKVDDKSKQEFWYNPKTGKSEWDKPEPPPRKMKYTNAKCSILGI